MFSFNIFLLILLLLSKFIIVLPNSHNMMVQHIFIKNNEVHLKIGGDHGGGSFKMSLQIVNTNSPNSKVNTILFTIFEAKDYRVNLKVALTRYAEQINMLQSSQWRYI